jgi:hypothetical protein
MTDEQRERMLLYVKAARAANQIAWDVAWPPGMTLLLWLIVVVIPPGMMWLLWTLYA